jgi:hypothetical protein
MRIVLLNVLSWSLGARPGTRGSLSTLIVLLQSYAMKDRAATPTGLASSYVMSGDLLFVQIAIGRVTSFCGGATVVKRVYAPDAGKTTEDHCMID